jgi:AcrR family transcriptional regulator
MAVDEALEAKTDPRIQRTRDHVLGVVMEILSEGVEPLTFSSVAERALVSRKTLYAHWGTVENLAAESLKNSLFGLVNFDGLDLRGRLRAFLVRNAVILNETGGASAIILMAAAPYDTSARTKLEVLEVATLDYIRDALDMTSDQYSRIIGPLLFKVLVHGDVSTEFVEQQVDWGMRVLSEGPNLS